MVNQPSIVLQSYNWALVSSDIAIEGSIATQGCFSLPFAYFYAVEFFETKLLVFSIRNDRGAVFEFQFDSIFTIVLLFVQLYSFFSSSLNFPRVFGISNKCSHLDPSTLQSRFSSHLSKRVQRVINDFCVKMTK